MNEGKLVIEGYIEEIEISKDGILIVYELKKDELISWGDKRINKFIPNCS